MPLSNYFILGAFSKVFLKMFKRMNKMPSMLVTVKISKGFETWTKIAK
jgi:hypothetical protein